VSRDLDQRLIALAEAAELAEGRLEPDVVEASRRVVQKAGARLGLGIENTVVALAGPTGVGKSSLFNILAGTELARVSRRRPTTSAGQAAAWGDGTDALLDWLEIPRRHRLEGKDLDGLVLLDLPDFDSVELAHRVEVERIVGLADLVVWVADPQKYADAALHDRYLRPLASHAAAMAVVLNQADTLPPAERAGWQADMKRLLAGDELRDVPLLAVSARTGDGLGELRRLLEKRVAARGAAVARLAADVDAALKRFDDACGGARPPGVRREDRDRLVAALEDAAGVPGVLRAVGAAHRRRGALATGWPFVRWIRRLRPDPLRRVRLSDRAQPSPPRSSVPRPSEIQTAQVETAARRLADGAARGLPSPWPRLVREAATASDERLGDELERAVAGADLHATTPRWWTVAGWLQRMFAFAFGAGMVWLLALAILGYLRVDDVIPVPELRGVPIPTWLLLGGAAAGIVLAFLARLANGAGARRRVRAAGKSLRREIEAVGEEHVVEPVQAELDAHLRLCAAVEAAQSG
jgi:GTP-binding protein EngB required for normal cell division